MLAIKPLDAQTDLDTSTPELIYGHNPEYTITRNNKVIGQHQLSFSRQGQKLVVDVTSDITIRVLKIPVYRFHYTSTEEWVNGEIQSVKAETTEKGRTRSHTYQFPDGNSDETPSTRVYPSNHWNAEVLQATNIFNTLTGKINQVKITKINQQTLVINGTPVNTTHYSYSGELTTDVWYDNQQRWVKLSFLGDDGSKIDYISEGFKTGVE